MKPTPTPHGHTGTPPRETLRRVHLVGTTSGSDLRPAPYHYPPSYTISSGGSAAIRVFSTKHPHRPSTEEYFLQRKHLLTTPPMILVPEKFDMGPSGTRPPSTRKDTKPNSQPLYENYANRISQNQQRPEPSNPSPSRGQVSTSPIFESAEGKFVDERSIV